MIAYLKGEIKEKLEKSIIININNVGYLVNITTTLLSELKEKETTELYIYTKVREDDISLFGFKTKQELTLFKLLISVSGIGAKTALDIMSKDIEKIQLAIINEDDQTLSQTPGIGKKTAKRIILDLKNKITINNIQKTEEQAGITTQSRNEAIEALINLGYKKAEINKILQEIPTSLKNTEEIITYFLKNI